MTDFNFSAKPEDNQKFLDEINFLKSSTETCEREISFFYGFLKLKIIVRKFDCKKEVGHAWLVMENSKNEESLEINFSAKDLCSFLSFDELANNAFLYFKENHNLQYKIFIEGLEND